MGGHIPRVTGHVGPMAAVGAALSCLSWVTQLFHALEGGSRGTAPRPAAADAPRDNWAPTGDRPNPHSGGALVLLAWDAGRHVSSLLGV